MTRQIVHTGTPSRSTGQSLIPLAFAILLIIALATPMLTVWAEPESTGQRSASVTEITITEITTNEESDRESRLRNMEDELLKQLSVGYQPTAPNEKKPSRADNKQISAEATEAKSTGSKISAVKAATAPTSLSQEPLITEHSRGDEEVRVPVVVYEEVPASAPRRPQSAPVIAVSRKSAAQRKTPIKKYSTTDTSSAKDLEHRLAITETQLNLITQELESTKNKLTTSEARVRELQYQLEDELQGTASPSDSSHSIGSRALVSRVVEPDTRSDVQTEVARVTRNKAPLRIGPGSRESILTHLSRDNVVSIEHRTSGWYRIITSDGSRGWISGSYLVFDTNLYSDSTVRVGAFEPSLEPTSGRY